MGHIKTDLRWFPVTFSELLLTLKGLLLMHEASGKAITNL